MAIVTSSFPPVTYPLAVANGIGLTYTTIHPDIYSIIDSSNNKFTFILYNNPFRQTSVYKYGTQSLSLDGISYLAGTYNSTFAFGTGNFTVEAWVYLKVMPTSDGWNAAYSGTSVLFGIGSVNAGDGFNCIIGMTKMFVQSNDVQYGGTIAHGMTINQWYHVAYCRLGNVLYFYVDGILKGSTAFTVTTGTGSGIWIGSETGQGANLNGYIDELRVTKGVARYGNSNFTPPADGYPTNSTDDPYFNDVSLLLKMEGDYVGVSTKTYLLSNPDRFFFSLRLTQAKDKSINNLPVSMYQSVALIGQQKKFGTSSAYFNGASLNYMAVANVPALGSTSFTIEFWVFPLVFDGIRVLFDMRPATGTYPTIYFNTTSLKYYTSNADRISSSTVPTIHNWYHVAVVRNGTTTTMYLNGVSQGSFSDTTNYLAGANTIIGSSFDNYPSYCFMDELRITSGVARYTSGFTPPTAAFPDSIAGDPQFNNVTLLLSMEPTTPENISATDLFNRNRSVTPLYRRKARNIQSIN